MEDLQKIIELLDLANQRGAFNLAQSDIAIKAIASLQSQLKDKNIVVSDKKE